MAARLLLVFAKEPQPGQVKTRLCPPLSAAQAAACQQAFLVDLLTRVKEVPDVTTMLCATPDDDAPELARLASRASVELRPQGPGDLGARMRRALTAAERADAAAVILGADSPDVPLDRIQAAFAWLEAPGIVVGPASDGGYYLIGSRGPVAPVFDLDAPWGSARVLEETLSRIRAAALRLLVLPPWEDVDGIAELRRLHARLEAAAAAGRANELPATLAALRALAADGVTA